MAGYKVAIIGAGSMGALLATRIPPTYRKVIIGRDRSEAAQVADEVGGIAADQVSAVRGCEVVFLAVPGADAGALVRDALPHFDDGALIVNMALDQPTDELAAEFRATRFASARVIGHPRELSLGSVGVVIIDHVDADTADELQHLLEGLGPVVPGKESMATDAVEAVAEALTRLRTDLQDRLSGLGLDARMARTAVTALAPGILRDLGEGDGTAASTGIMDKLNFGSMSSPRASH